MPLNEPFGCAPVIARLNQRPNTILSYLDRGGYSESGLVNWCGDIPRPGPGGKSPRP
ncbi:MAG: hypothetical protein PVF83_12510 [Anaerolineales bacterium]